eukprot:3424937-Lingulodinium_polyedra.AAC.1
MRKSQSKHFNGAPGGRATIPALPCPPGTRKNIFDTAEDGRVVRLRNNAQQEIETAFGSLATLKDWSGIRDEETKL